MPAFWISFTLENDAGWNQRYEALTKAVSSMATQPVWDDTTAFLVFESGLGIDDVAGRVARAINPGKDTALIGMPDFKSARLVGVAAKGAELARMMPFAQRYVMA